MPKGITHVTPPRHEMPMMVSYAAHPLSNDYQSSDRVRLYYTASLLGIQAAIASGVYPFFGVARLSGEKSAATARRFR